ncbi:hypothetical protein [Halomonas organivorans]|uniref:Uncharacterized protein n=1 Tax=Halomonas organivorans TaxID=257772 RepID=A0A7W5C0M0_9GAMM|nr:hypothetical protein [Halomonas organivorans]MBB3142661.1 hypothetical protein [Halomonas organivorans]
MSRHYPRTPDGRYFVARQRLWRCTDPRLDETTRRDRVRELMRARRAVKAALGADDDAALAEARAAVQAAKLALGERGPVWWDDGAPDEAGRHPANSSYAAWWRAHEDVDAR